MANLKMAVAIAPVAFLFGGILGGFNPMVPVVRGILVLAKLAGVEGAA